MSPTAPGAIVRALGDIGKGCVLEIGPGKGAITRQLAARSQALIAVEVDPALAAALREQFANTPSIEILCQDILTLDLSDLAHRHQCRLIVTGNLPYYITSEILLHLFHHHTAIESAVLMVQREVAQRISASPGSREYGLLSATAQMYARVETLFSLPPSAFSPPPEVHSTVFRLTMQPRFTELGVPPETFLHFLRQAFAQKRKTLANNLRFAGFVAAAIQAGFDKCKVDPLIRAEAVPLETMAGLFRTLEGKKAASSE